MTYDAPPNRPAGTNTYAIVSLILGIVSFFTCGCLISIPGVILGNMALKEVRVTGQEGEGLAKAGVIICWVNIGLTVLVTVAYMLFILLAVMSGSMS
ncbi:MAG: DUF4190 domain-containing protein [Candidatus Hydrogenedentes bacterium]|nr:DUF4190 domain-containing protein [Candidatus Hydrogenedentota bacterium]